MSNFVFSAEKENFLPEYLIMVDCEMTGVVPDKDDLLQVAMTRLKLNGHTYQEEGEPLELFLHSDKQPENDFQNKFLTHIFKKCNESTLYPPEAKQLIENWLGDLKGKATPVGDCVIADLRFLYANDMIVDSYYEGNDPVPGTFHYEIFDMNSLKCVVRTLWGEKRKPKDADLEHEHDALVDCRNQTLELNQMLEHWFAPQVVSVWSGDYSEGVENSLNTWVVSSELPANIAPSVEVVDLPEHIIPSDIELEYGELMLLTENFEQVQGLINKIMLEKEITEEYRPSLAGLINQFRIENELTPM